MHDPVLFWTVFHIAIVFLLACDFFLFQRSGPMSGKKAWGLSAFWILLALIFNGLIYYSSGSEAALQFFTAYLVEKSLSIDNLFVFLILFSRFKLSLEEQRKVLFWGVFGAIIFRLIFILLGIKVLMALHWMVYVLGAFLCFTGIKLLFRSGKKPDLERNVFLRFFEDRVKLPSFFLALLMIESADILFALFIRSRQCSPSLETLLSPTLRTCLPFWDCALCILWFVLC